MTRQFLLCTTVSSLSLFSAHGAFADMTSDAVWEQWQGYLGASGYSVEVGNAAKNGGTLTVSDVALSMDTEGSVVNMTLPELVFSENGDGTVNVTVPASYPMRMQLQEAGDVVDVTMTISQTDLVVNVSGDPDDTSYDITAANVALSVDEVAGDDQTLTDLAMFEFEGIQSAYTLKTGELYEYDEASSINALGITANVNIPEENSSFKMTASLSDLTSKSTMAIPLDGDPDNVASYFDGGMMVDGAFAYGAGTYDISGSEDGSDFAINGGMSGGDLSVDLSGTGMGYGGSVRDLTVSISGSDIPLPSIDVAMAEYVYNFLMPISKSDTPEDFALTTKMIDLSVSDMLWGLVDPSGGLPRDPATLILDMTGKANWNIDIMDPENSENMAMDGMPGEIHALTLNELQLKAAGADLTGTGAFTFDNNDLTTFPGFPRPTGQVDLQLVGGNGLIDKLVELGLLPEEQAMGARMMLGLFARQGDGADTLLSTIEVDDSGAVSANGQRLR